MAVTTGQISTEGVLADERIVDMSEIIHRRQVERAAFKTILEKIGTKPATREKISWLEEDLVPRVSSTAASATSAATSITVTTGHGNTVFRVYDVVRATESDEALLVTSVSANSIGVTRGLGGSSAASATSACELMIIGNAAAQGASSGTAQYVPRTLAYNYIQDQRNPLFFTDTQTDIALHGGGEPEKELIRKADEHIRAVENTLFRGARSLDTSTPASPRGTCGGASEYITTHVSDVAGQLTPTEMDTFLEGPFGVSGSGNKVLFCAPRVATVLSQMYRDKWQPTTAGADVTYGAKTNAFIHSTYGTSIPVFVKREWSDLGTSANEYGTWAFLIDLDHVRLRVLNGRMNQIRKGIQEPSSTAIVHEYRTVFSLEFGVESAHGILKDVTSYSAS